MTVAASITCPHCSAANPVEAQFCEACGMALPSAVSGTPRVLDGKAFAATTAGQRLQSEELHAQQKKAATALMWVAIIQTVAVGLQVAVSQQRGGGSSMVDPTVVVLGVVAVLFWGLFVWARVQPLPAAIVGMVLYATLLAINVIVSVSHLTNGGQPGTNGVGIGLVNILILAVLARAISAGMKYRKMMASGIA